ncbi:hypothetical protein ACO0LO_18595 [Undibacterium sp. TJN25]|uniref:hypothetical protein n=1 Tax=Undibacterium sp. TJN25 TaxID=3413056 RepID=UPI003BF0DDD7
MKELILYLSLSGLTQQWRQMLVAVMGILLLASAAQAQELVLKGQPFLQARELILADGWLPLRFVKEEDSIFREGKWQAAVPEWDGCPAAFNGCFFNYIKEKQCLRLFVWDTRLTKMKVIEVFYECPGVGGVPVSDAKPVVAPRKAKGDPWEPEEDMPFAEARKQILAHGWKPVDMVARNERGHEFEWLERQIIARGWREMEFCTASGRSDCTFYYTKKKECMAVVATGERIKDMKVDIWVDECPDPKR